ncbi:heavy-metal-associated domain-containing protein [Isoptericola croceus]|uniref:heavy-metal-associated domain-containing protein n=1 Tax=Isoptericola croceus TaxID=3031406 RepID=UPI0023F8E09B|nr:heavy-metal-associated domain-containing protein [Isoptericola croceus]
MSTVTTLGVTGMTCANCVAHVTSDLESVDGVEHVSVVLQVGGESEATVFSREPLDEQALRDAVDEAGYAVASLTVQPDALREQSAEQAAGRQRAHDEAAHHAGASE